MITSIDQFTKIIPTAFGTLFEDIEPFLKEGLLWTKTEIFGKDLIDKIESFGEDSEKEILNTIIALKAYSGAIPFLDVVQTKNGFAVVNNSNVVPASRERVDKLISWVDNRLNFTIDSMVAFVEAKSDYVAEWKKFNRFGYYTELLYWTNSEFNGYCRSNGTLHGSHIKLKGYMEREIASLISMDYLCDLIEKRQNASLSEKDKSVYEKLKIILGLLFNNDAYRALESLKDIVNFMVANLGDFPKYAESVEYRLKISEKYENKKEDTCYFFG